MQGLGQQASELDARAGLLLVKEESVERQCPAQGHDKGGYLGARRQGKGRSPGARELLHHLDLSVIHGFRALPHIRWFHIMFMFGVVFYSRMPFLPPTSFSRLLRHAEDTKVLFFNPGNHTGD